VCHQICTVCGKVMEVSIPEVTQAINDVHLKRFHKDGYNLYIYGICTSCSASITRKRNKEKKQKNKINKDEK
jgi:Fur family ferric uptake transcriptional regulator